MRFKIDLRIFLFLVLFYFTKQIEMYLMILLFGFIHELGHLVVGLLVGMKPENISLMPFGLSISFKIKNKDMNIRIRKGNLLELKKIIVAMAGPLTNVLIIFISGKLQIDLFTYLMILFSNILIILYNLIPIYPMDGGRILKGIIYIILGEKKSNKYIHNVSLFIIICLTVVSSIGILYLKNIAIFLAIMYLWYMYLIENRHYRIQKNIYEIIENY